MTGGGELRGGVSSGQAGALAVAPGADGGGAAGAKRRDERERGCRIGPVGRRSSTESRRQSQHAQRPAEARTRGRAGGMGRGRGWTDAGLSGPGASRQSPGLAARPPPGPGRRRGVLSWSRPTGVTGGAPHRGLPAALRLTRRVSPGGPPECSWGCGGIGHPERCTGWRQNGPEACVRSPGGQGGAPGPERAPNPRTPEPAAGPPFVRNSIRWESRY